MRISANALLRGAALAAIVATGLPARSQTAPESILPPGFGEPVAPAPAPTPGATPPPSSTVPDAPLVLPSGEPTPEPSPTDTPLPIDLAAYELPDYAKRSLDSAGAVSDGGGGLSADAFTGTDGRMIETLMRRLDAPLPSRWLSIALRRALMSRVLTPAGVNGADFAAERAWLLIRMGEADAARAVVQSVDVENYTPKLFQVAMQAMLATGDPAGLCPIAEPAAAQSDEAGWAFARAICAGLAGKATVAGQLYEQARRRTGRSIDSLLAEKVLGAGAGGRRAVTIEWDGVDRLTSWRIGMAMATGVDLPAPLLAGVRPQVAAWRATSPMLGPVARAGVADYAASQGVLSNLALVDLYSEIDASDDTNSPASAVARDLRSAFAEPRADDRIAALRGLWSEPTNPRGRYARLVLTARAAARVPADARYADAAANLVAAMLSAGLDRQAMRWGKLVPGGSDAWAMLALADPIGGSVSAGDVRGYGGAGDNAADKTKLLLAGLAGLGRIPLDDAQELGASLDVRFGAANAWTRAIAAAASRHEAGTVILLAAVGMQTGDWRGVPPEMLFHSVAALCEVGLAGEARMIAAEAIARL